MTVSRVGRSLQVAVQQDLGYVPEGLSLVREDDDVTRAGDPPTGGGQRPVLTVTGLGIAYATRRGIVPAVEDVSFTVSAGETVALVGESGSGKTTSAHAVVGLLPAQARRIGGSVLLGDTDITAWSQRRLSTIRGRHVGFVPQDPGVALNPVQRIGTQVAEALLIHRLVDRRRAPVRALEILTDAGIDDPESVAHRYPHELSGGQRQRVLIGIALSCDPHLVIADEPTSALDVTVQKVVLDHLQERTRASGTSLLLITHDLAVAADRADRIVVLKDGRVVEHGPAVQVLQHPREEYTRRLVDAAPSLHSIRIVPTVAVADRGPATPVLALTGIGKTYTSGSRRVVVAAEGVDLTVERGRTTALVGSSGSGKTTVARIAARLTRADSGSIELGERDITTAGGTELRRLRRRLQYVHQDPYSSLDPRMTVSQIIAAPLRAHHRGGRAERTRRAAELADTVALPSDVLTRLPRELSGGQRQRVAIARALALSPDVLILDEPVSALDVSVQDQILRLLTDLQATASLGYLFITHDMAVVRQISDTVGVMERGRVVEYGPVDEVFAHPRHDATRALLDAIPGRLAQDRTERSLVPDGSIDTWAR